MSTSGLPQRWAQQFGLALAPLFGIEEVVKNASHAVLLDGGYGSFAMSETDEELWRHEMTASWAWSSNLPHHVTVTSDLVAVTRCDRSDPDLFDRDSVEKQFDSFYNFLSSDRARPNQRVVDSMLSVFRRVRSLVAESKLPDEFSTDIFLAFLAEMIERDHHEANSEERRGFLKTQDSTELLRRLPESGVESLMDELRLPSSLRPFRLFPSLAVRHAGSEIFQEAHFELLRVPSLDMFDYVGPAEANPVTRGGAHFTPAALARCIVEQTLLQIEDLRSRRILTVLDPACGSGSFLHEALRALVRDGFSGRVVLVGRDISVSAISMAEFVVRHAAADCSPEVDVVVDIKVADSLAEPLPRANIILTNPPFISWPMLSDLQRLQMRKIVGNLHGRSDISMAFVTRSIDALWEGGALGVLLPRSLLTLDAATGWRHDLMERGELRLLASLGDYGLFAHALVQVAAAILFKPIDPRSRRDVTTAVVTNNSAEATGNALRNLRRSVQTTLETSEDRAWHIFDVSTKALQSRPTWRLTTPKVESAVARLLERGAVPLAELFEVRQGIRTGYNPAFLLRQSDYQDLPKKEKEFFKPAVVKQSIQDGRLRLLSWVFYPYTVEGPAFATEDELLASVPIYAQRFLAPSRGILAGRKTYARSRNTGWWGLTERRSTWAFDSRPRLVSKYFGGTGGFAIDPAPRYLVVQGYAWFLKFSPLINDIEDEESMLALEDLLCAYLSILNSRRFSKVLELFSPQVAGGQFNLSPKYVNHVPIFDLALLADDRMDLVYRLVELGDDPRPSDPEWITMADEITTALYGDDFFSLL